MLGALLAAGTSACRGAATALGSTTAEARTNADLLFGALAVRWRNVERTPKFDRARTKLGRHALSPSGIINDTSVWSAGTAGARALIVRASLIGDRYTFVPLADAAVPVRPGDSRHIMRLRQLGESDYEWTTTVDQNVGSASPDEIARAFGAFLSGAEGQTEEMLRAGYRTAFPRTTQELGTLFTLDSVRTTRLADGSTSLALGFRARPERLEPTLPNFAKYVEKYVVPARFRLTLADDAGSQWFDMTANRGFFAVRLRTRDGKLLALDGPPRPMPDSLRIRLDFVGRFLIFDVGYTNLVGDFTMLRSDAERGWAMRFRREPKWHLPFAASHFLRAPLRRPFEGDGSALVLSVRRTPDGQTLLHRLLHVTVRESAIVRWLGGLGFSAMSDFAGRAELEENHFNADALSAIRADMVALLGGR